MEDAHIADASEYAKPANVDRYTEKRRETLGRLMNNLVSRKMVDTDNLPEVRDLGCFQGSSSKAWVDNGAKHVVGIDQNLHALQVGTAAGYISEFVNMDMVDYARDTLPNNFDGVVSAFNCVLYLPEPRIGELFSSLEQKLDHGSQVVISFSKSQDEWVSKFNRLFESSGKWDTKHLQNLTTGELDYNVYVLTRK